LRSSGISRSEVTVISKFWGSSHHDVAGALEKSLKDLDIDYIDIYLMHWPCTMTLDDQPQAYPGNPPYWEAWKSLEKCVGDKCRTIGVSNFTQKTLDVLLQHASIVPAVNQVELHAMNPNLKLVPYCLDKGIRVISWSTMGGERHEDGKNPILTHSLFTDIAKKYGVSTGVLSLSWAVQRGIAVIPKSSRAHRIEENIRLVELSEEDVATMNRAQEKVGKMRLTEIISGIHYQFQGRDTVLGWSDEDFGWSDSNGHWLV
jgi:glycerol 2-dehydrogenase (NADP+)